MPYEPLSAEEVALLVRYLETHKRTPEAYITGQFAHHDVVLLAVDNGVKHNLELVHRLIPLLHDAGVCALGMEFGASEDQAALDALVTAPEYDEDLARRLMVNYNVGWAYVEYMDVYRKAWEFNRSLAIGEQPFRVLNLSYRFDWRDFNGIKTPKNIAKVFHKGPVDRFRAGVVKREILDRREKILILTGTIHAFTRYAMPVFDTNAEGFVRLDDRNLGNLLYRESPERVCTILLHQPFFSATGGFAELVPPANGAVEQVMTALGDKRIGFDLAGSPLGQLADFSFYATGHAHLHLDELADGYVYERPFAKFEGCTVDERFFTESNWPEAQRQFPDPDMHPRPASPVEYLERIRTFVDFRKRYQGV